MALTQSVDKVDESGREILTYGTEYFPIAFFDDDLTKVAVPPHWPASCRARSSPSVGDRYRIRQASRPAAYPLASPGY